MQRGQILFTPAFLYLLVFGALRALIKLCADGAVSWFSLKYSIYEFRSFLKYSKRKSLKTTSCVHNLRVKQMNNVLHLIFRQLAAVIAFQSGVLILANSHVFKSIRLGYQPCRTTLSPRHNMPTYSIWPNDTHFNFQLIFATYF